MHLICGLLTLRVGTLLIKSVLAFFTRLYSALPNAFLQMKQ